MRGLLVVVAACFALAGPAQAKIVTLTMNGTLLSKYAGLTTTTMDSPLEVGDPVSATLIFNDHYRRDYQGHTYFTTYHYGGEMSLNAGSFVAHNTHDINDGTDAYWSDYNPFVGDHEYLNDPDWRGLGSPQLVFKGSQFLGFDTQTSNYWYEPEAPGWFVGGFDFELGESYYGPYFGPYFGGRFDPNSVRYDVWPSVPEPSTWAMMIIGFCLTGAALRRRRGLPRRTVTA